MKKRVGILVLIIAVVFVAGGCMAGNVDLSPVTDAIEDIKGQMDEIKERIDDLETAPDEDVWLPEQTEADPETTASSTPVPVPTDAPVEHHFGFIEELAVSGDTYTATVDYVEFLTGEDAIAAYAADNDMSEAMANEELPNGFYIQNINSQLRTFEITEETQITILTDGVETQPATPEHFYSRFIADPVMFNFFEFTIRGNGIIRMEEIYTP